LQRHLCFSSCHIKFCVWDCPIAVAPSLPLCLKSSRIERNLSTFFYYVDDIAVVSSTFQQHIDHLGLVFSTIKENSLMLNPSKTSLANREIEFLGHTVNKHGIKISDSKMSAIRNIQAPTNRRSLQRLLGLLQYFRKYVGNFSRRTCHMRQLLRQDVNFAWDEACEAELQDIKLALESGQILAPFKNDQKIYHRLCGSAALL